MPGEGLHIPVDANDKDLRQLAASLRKVKQEAAEASKALKGVGSAAATGHAGGGNGAHTPAAHAGGQRGGFLHSLARLTRGTEFGHLAHLGANVQSVGGGGGIGMMALGAGIGAAVVGLTMLKNASEAAAEAAKREVEMRQEMTHSIRDAIKAADAKAVGAFSSNKDALLSLAGMGGDQAVNAAKKLGEQVGPGGIKAFATLSGMHGGMKDSNLEGARAAAETGQISIEKAADMIASGKVRSGMDPMDQAAAILSQETGHRVTAADVREMGASLKGSKLGAASARFEQGEGLGVSAGIDRFTTQADGGTISAGQGKDRADIVNPEMAGRLEMAQKLQETKDQIQAAADAQFKTVALFEDILHFYSLGAGSQRTQLAQLNASEAAATAH